MAGVNMKSNAALAKQSGLVKEFEWDSGEGEDMDRLK